MLLWSELLPRVPVGEVGSEPRRLALAARAIALPPTYAPRRRVSSPLVRDSREVKPLEAPKGLTSLPLRGGANFTPS